MFVRSDPSLLARLIRNLLSNAVRYTDSGGSFSDVGAWVLRYASKSGIAGKAFLSTDTIVEQHL